MRTINGVDVLTTIEELVEPTRTAVIVIDMQNEIVSAEGGYAKAGTDISNVAAIVPQIQRLLRAARELGVLITYAEFVHRNELGASLVDGPYMYCHRNATFVSDVVEGSWEAQTVDALAPQVGDIVIRKSRASAMYHTMLDDVLQTRGIWSLIITGCVTGGCVLQTAADARHHGYYAVIVRDCVAAYDLESHDRALMWMEGLCPVFNLDEVLAAWQKMGLLSS
jgi:nicotinamidase-related amidase